MRTIFLFSLVILFFSCSEQNAKSKLQNWSENYFETLALREDSAKFYSFYADDFQYLNVNFDNQTNTPKELVNVYYDWYNTDFQYLNNKTLNVENISFNDSIIYASGYFSPYRYNDLVVDSTKFIIELELDKNLKIKKQTDWINYDLGTIIDAHSIKNSLNIE